MEKTSAGEHQTVVSREVMREGKWSFEVVVIKKTHSAYDIMIGVLRDPWDTFDGHWLAREDSGWAYVACSDACI